MREFCELLAADMSRNAADHLRRNGVAVRTDHVTRTYQKHLLDRKLPEVWKSYYVLAY